LKRPLYEELRIHFSKWAFIESLTVAYQLMMFGDNEEAASKPWEAFQVGFDCQHIVGSL